MAETSISSEKRGTSSEEAVVLEYIKSSLFRVIHSDGVIGGVTPAGNLHIAFFSERLAIPKMEVYARNPDGTLGEMLTAHTVVRPGAIREMDVDVVLDKSTALSLRAWLEGAIKELEAHEKTE